jgi:hypothetical protein
MTKDKCRCGTWLWSEIERDLGTCNRCLDAEYEGHRERAEFEYFHPKTKTNQAAEAAETKGE